MHHIANNIKFYRLRNRFRQTEIAAKLNTTLGRVKSYESGAATPPVSMLIKIADMMHISIDTLIKVNLTPKNYLEVKGQTAPDLLQRVAALEKIVNKKVNKTRKNGQK